MNNKLTLDDLIPIIGYIKLEKFREFEYYQSSKARFIRAYNLVTLPLWTSAMTLSILYLGDKIYNLLK